MNVASCVARFVELKRRGAPVIDLAWHRERVRTRIMYVRLDASSPVEVLSHRLTLRNTWDAYRLAMRGAHGARKAI